MAIRQCMILAASLLVTLFLFASRDVPGQLRDDRVIRIAEIEVDPAQVAAYTAALKQEIDASTTSSRVC